MMIAYLKNNPKKLDKFLGKAFIPPSQGAAFMQIAHRVIEMMPDNELLKLVENGLIGMDEIADQFPIFAKVGQNEALVLDVANQSRTKSHLERNHSVFRPGSGSFILPDTTLAFVKKKGASPFSQKDDQIEAVILPIASDAAIVGRSSGEFDLPLKAVNRLLASCSFEAFLAKEKNTYFQGFTGRIGKYANLIRDLELQDLIDEYVRDHRSA